MKRETYLYSNQKLEQKEQLGEEAMKDILVEIMKEKHLDEENLYPS